MGNRTDLDSRFNGVVNLSQARLCRLHDFDELRLLQSVVTVPHNPIVSLNPLGRFRKIYSIRCVSAATTITPRKLIKVLSKSWDEVIPQGSFFSEGIPTHYTMWGKDQIELWRIPQETYSLQLRSSLWPQLVDDTFDGSYLDLENVDDLIIHLSASYLFMSLGNVDKANEFFKIYAALAKEAIDEDEEDFDTHMAAHSAQVSGLSRGYDDPFVRSVEVPQD